MSCALCAHGRAVKFSNACGKEVKILLCNTTGHENSGATGLAVSFSFFALIHPSPSYISEQPELPPRPLLLSSNLDCAPAVHMSRKIWNGNGFTHGLQLVYSVFCMLRHQEAFLLTNDVPAHSSTTTPLIIMKFAPNSIMQPTFFCSGSKGSLLVFAIHGLVWTHAPPDADTRCSTSHLWIWNAEL